MNLSNGNKLDIKYPIELKNARGDVVYYETALGTWSKREYDADGNRTYYENSRGYWAKREFDANGFRTYYENSLGEIFKQTLRPSVVEMTMADIEKLAGHPVKVIK